MPENMNHLHLKNRQVNLLCVYCVLTVCYADLTVSARFGVTFVDALFDGKPLSFYHLANLAGITHEGAIYDIGYYILYGLWDFPVWVLHKLTGLATDNTWCLIWYKGPLVIFTVLSALETVKMAESCGVIGKYTEGREAALQEKQKIILLYITSVTVFFSVFISCQCDVIPLYFVLKGTNYYFEDRRWSFLAMFSAAMSMKPFPVFWLALLIVFRQKRLDRIIADCLLGSGGFIISRVLYYFSPSFPAERQKAMTENPLLFLNVMIEGGRGKISLFFAVLVLILIFAFADKCDIHSIVSRKKLMVYLYCVWGAFIIFTGAVPYWTIYFAPASVLVVYMLHSDAAMLTDLAVNIALAVTFILRYTWVYGGSMTYSYLLLKPLLTEEMAADGNTVAGILRHFYMQEFEPMFHAIVFAGMLYIAYSAFKTIHNEGNGAMSGGKAQKEAAIEESNVKDYMPLRILFLCGFVAMTLVALWTTLMGI